MAVMARVKQDIRVSLEALNQPSVLAIDDDPDSLELLLCLFEDLPYKLHCACDGQSGLLIAERELPNLILLDIMLPNISGLDLTKALKKNPRTCHIPVVAVTALAYAHEQVEIIEAGCDGYLSKPYSIDDLETLIQSYLSQEESVI